MSFFFSPLTTAPPTEDAIAQLTGMGFSREAAVDALGRYVDSPLPMLVLVMVLSIF